MNYRVNPLIISCTYDEKKYSFSNSFFYKKKLYKKFHIELAFDIIIKMFRAISLFFKKCVLRQPDQRPSALIEVGLPLGETDNAQNYPKTGSTSFHASIFYQLLTLRLAHSDRRIILQPYLILDCGFSTHIT